MMPWILSRVIHIPAHQRVAMLSRLLESLSSIAKKQRPLGSEEADSESGPPLLLDLQDELWVECILRTGK